MVLSQPYVNQGLFTFPRKVLTKTIQAMMVNIYFKIYRRATSKKQSNQGTLIGAYCKELVGVDRHLPVNLIGPQL